MASKVQFSALTVEITDLTRQVGEALPEEKTALMRKLREKKTALRKLQARQAAGDFTPAEKTAPVPNA